MTKYNAKCEMQNAKCNETMVQCENGFCNYLIIHNFSLMIPTMKKFFLTLALLLCASFAAAEEEAVIQGPESVQAVFHFKSGTPDQTREFKLEQKGNVQFLTIPATEVELATGA